MAVEIPTLDNLYNQILNDYATQLSVDITDLGDSYLVRAKVQAGILYQLYITLSSVQKNVFYDTADEDQLIRQGKQIIGRTPSPASPGEYTIQVTGQIGAVIPASTQFKANDSTEAAGFLFIVDNEFTLTATTDSLTVRALTPGLEPLLYVDDLLTSTQPIVNVDSEVTVLSVDIEPSAAEDIESYREDVLQFVRLEPQGGSSSDYRLWASDVPGVRTVYPYLKSGSPGDVEIFIEATIENSKPLGIPGEPTDQTINDVYTPQVGATPESGVLIWNDDQQRGRKPIGVFNIFTFSVDPVAVDLYLTDLTDETLSSQIRTVVDSLMYDVRPFVAGADNITAKNNILTIAAIINVVFDLLSGTGITYTDISMEIGSLTVTSYEFDRGFYPYLRNIYNNSVAI